MGHRLGTADATAINNSSIVSLRYTDSEMDESGFSGNKEKITTSISHV